MEIRCFNLASVVRLLWRSSVMGASVLGFTLAAVMFLPILRPCIQMLAGPWTDARDGIMIVLANDYNANGILGPGSYWRTVYAIHAWREGGFKEIVLSGPSIIVDPMQDFLIKSGVPASAIVMETESRTTHESAYYVMRLLSGSTDRKVLLRSDYHMYRAYHAFLKSGLNIAPRPFPDAAKRIGSIPERWPVFTGLVIETVKIGWYRLHGWI